MRQMNVSMYVGIIRTKDLNALLETAFHAVTFLFP